MPDLRAVQWDYETVYSITTNAKQAARQLIVAAYEWSCVKIRWGRKK